jgi:hypothetical protein
MKKPTQELRKRMCSRKRRYRSQGDALDAALLAGVERQRQAYRCPLCGQWHLTGN